MKPAAFNDPTMMPSGTLNSNYQQKQSFDFTYKNLNSTHHAELRNLESRSQILAPFNTTKTNLNSLVISDSVRELIVDKHDVLILGMRVKEIDKDYEHNNNCDLDNGVFNKFLQQQEKNNNNNLDKHRSRAATAS